MRINKRELKLDKYGISKKRYKELCGFCEQYPEWKAMIRNYSFNKGVGYSQTPRSVTNNISSPTEEAAIKLEKYMSNCEFIEEVAKKADSEYWNFLIKSVCYGVNVTYLINVDDMSISKSAFYERRRYFFYLLDKEKV